MSRLMRAEPPSEPAAAPSSRRWAIGDVAFVFLRVATAACCSPPDALIFLFFALTPRTRD